tara:strand:+ start:448 stop:882 length:435 start_codon:yes stop_codon:yes gene_type:complete
LIYKYNVKVGDVVVTNIGSGLLIGETRQKWFYVMNNRKSSMSKDEFWNLVDLGQMKIQYAEDKKYRRLKKSGRILNLTDVKVNDWERSLEEFVKFVRLPFQIAVSDEDLQNLKYDFLLEKIRDLNYDFSIDGKYRETIFIKVTK